MCKKKRKNLRYFCIFSRFGGVARGLGEKKRGFGSGGWRESGYQRRFMARERSESGDFNLAGTSASTRPEDETLAHRNREHRTLARTTKAKATSRLLAKHIRLV